MHALLMWFAVATSASLSGGVWKETRSYRAPDLDGIVALVRADSSGESSVEIKAADDKILLHRDQTSPDQEHGYSVVQAAWTEDAQYFVVSTAATGGHQPWARPIWVYCRSNNQVINLATWMQSPRISSG